MTPAKELDHPDEQLAQLMKLKRKKLSEIQELDIRIRKIITLQVDKVKLLP